jgi:hypothetical protein
LVSVGQLGDVRPSRPPFFTFRYFGFNQPLRSFGSHPDSEVRLWPKEKNEKTDVCYAGVHLFDNPGLFSSRSRDNTKEATAQENQKAATASKTVTGCLQKGHEPGELSITGEDGKTWS